MNADAIDYQIEVDFSGLIAPGLPKTVITLGEKFGRLMNYGDGLYGGQFVGAMYAESFFEEDLTRIVEAGLKAIPAGSQYAEMVRDVLKWHGINCNVLQAKIHSRTIQFIFAVELLHFSSDRYVYYDFTNGSDKPSQG